MDKTDLKILNALQADARISLKALADQCFISSPAISARITRLKKSGIIRDYQANLNFEKLNYHIKAYIQLQLEPTQRSAFTHLLPAFLIFWNVTVSRVNTLKF